MRVLLTLLLLALPGLAGAEPLPVTLLPPEVVLGRDPVVVVRVATPPDAPPLRAAASTGRLTPQRSSKPGESLFIWTPPDIRYPLLAVLAFWTDSPDGPPEITRVPIPLLGRNELTVDTAAGAQVVVEVAGRSFGPARADRRGKAKVTVQVPPGVSKASVRVTSTRQRPSLRTIPLDVPPEQPLLAVMSPESLPAGGNGWLVLMGAQPVPGSQLRLRVQGASTREELPSVFRVKPEPGANAVVVEAQRADGTGSARLTTHVVTAVARFTPAPPPPALVVPLAAVTPALVLGPVMPPLPALRLPPTPFPYRCSPGAFSPGGTTGGRWPRWAWATSFPCSTVASPWRPRRACGAPPPIPSSRAWARWTPGCWPTPCCSR